MSDWFEKMVEKKVNEVVEYEVNNLDLGATIRSEVEDIIGHEVTTYMNHTFDINDHIDIMDRVNVAVSEVITDEVSSALEDQLEDAITEVLSNKTITINL